MTQDDRDFSAFGNALINVVTVNTSTTAFIPKNARRVALLIQTPQTNRVTIAPGAPAVLDQGITLYPGQYPLDLNLQNHGPLVTHEWQAISAVAAQALSWIEAVAP